MNHLFFCYFISQLILSSKKCKTIHLVPPKKIQMSPLDWHHLELPSPFQQSLKQVWQHRLSQNLASIFPSPITKASVSMQTINDNLEFISSAAHWTIPHTLPPTNEHASLCSSLLVPPCYLPSNTCLGPSVFLFQKPIQWVTPSTTSCSLLKMTCKNEPRSSRKSLLLAYFDPMPISGTNISFGKPSPTPSTLFFF